MMDFTAIGIDLPHGRHGNVRALCPRCSEVHHNRKQTLSCDTERGVFQCFRCGWKGNVRGSMGWTERKPDPSALEVRRRKRQYVIDTLLRESVPLTHPDAQPARTYLSRRMGRILAEYPNLRFHRAARCYHNAKHQGDHPCLIGEVRDINGRLVTLHRTYLTDDGQKAHLNPVRKLTGVPQGSCSGAAIRLSEPTTELVLAEGIETALALSLLRKQPAWACISAHGLETVVIPDSVEVVHIGADNDASETGQRAARQLALRLWEQGLRAIFIHTPDEVGTDWADVIRQGGSDGD